MAPSQSAAAVAGVQLASRQQCSLLPFFHTVPSLARQLSTVWADTPDAAKKATANSDATRFNFFMILLSRKAADALRYVHNQYGCVGLNPKLAQGPAIDHSLCHRALGPRNFVRGAPQAARQCCALATRRAN
jgi:hypothetical protein